MPQPLLTSRPERSKDRVSDVQVWAWFFFLSSMFWPRLFILGFWIFDDQIGEAFDHAVVPVIGFFAAPWTTFTYAMAWGLSSDRVSGFEWVLVGLAVAVDLWTYLAGRSLFSR